MYYINCPDGFVNNRFRILTNFGKNIRQDVLDEMLCIYEADKSAGISNN